MRAVIFREYGGPDKLEYVAGFPEPVIADDEVLVRVRACALNHLDIWVRQGIPALKLPLPHISGCDASGEVARAGKNARGIEEGQAVVIAPGASCWQCAFCKSGRDNICEQYSIIGENRHGALAEYVKVKATQILPKPANLSFEEAAAYPLVFLTAWHMLFAHAGIGPEKNVLILAAGAGVGQAAVQIAKYAGARMILAAASNKEKLDKARLLGAHQGILVPRDAKAAFYRDVLKATSGEGVDIIFEHVGSVSMDSSVKSLRKGGIVVTCGATSGPQAAVDLRYFFMRELRLQGSIMGTLEEMKTITRLMAEGRLKPVIDSIFPLEETRAAQEKMLSRDFFGKIVIKV
ncbi:MAG: zinc-binding dehydrogenase [Elusimicrobia bacterium]|nr:zinc-binding dehydrogenase [Elusimicrobiota bacterium]